MAVALLATPDELSGISDIESVRTWAGLDEGVWSALNAHLGTAPNVRTLAVIPRISLQHALQTVRVTSTGGEEGQTSQRSLTPVEVTQAGLMWRVARQKYGLVDLDPYDSDALPQPAPGQNSNLDSSSTHMTTTSVRQTQTRQVKMSQVLDQANDGVIPVLTQEEVDLFYATLRGVKGGPPLTDADPSPEQISALKVRVIDHGDSPWADFALFTPFNARFLKQLKFKSYVLQSDGSFKTVEVPGPANFEIWQSSWKVFQNVLLGLTVQGPDNEVLPVVTPCVLEEYFENFRELVGEYPNAWHLCVVAEDRCRAEHFARIRRKRLLEHQQGLAPGFNPKCPWNDVFREAARDTVYWGREVRNKALAFIANGGESVPMVMGSPTLVVPAVPASVRVVRSIVPRARRIRTTLAQLATRLVVVRDWQSRTRREVTRGRTSKGGTSQHVKGS
jgi:hypothetical protein